MRKYVFFSVVVCICLVGLLQVKSGFSMEAQLYAITTWNSDCSGGARSKWDDMGNAWYDEITDDGFSIGSWCWWGHCDDAYSRDRRMINGNIGNGLFCDPDSISCGRDYNYVDEGDAAMICTHGGDDNGYWSGVARINDGCDDCRINARDELRVGDFDLEFLHLSSCHSLDDNMIANAWRIFRDPNDSPSNGRRLHQLNGFHGCMWIDSYFISNYEYFADDAFDEPIKDAWMDNMYRTNVNGQYTQCPIAYAVGSSSSDCFNRINNERYDRVFSDPGTIRYYCYYYYPGCDPACESAWGTDTSN